MSILFTLLVFVAGVMVGVGVMIVLSVASKDDDFDNFS